MKGRQSRENSCQYSLGVHWNSFTQQPLIRTVNILQNIINVQDTVRCLMIWWILNYTADYLFYSTSMHKIEWFSTNAWLYHGYLLLNKTCVTTVTYARIKRHNDLVVRFNSSAIFFSLSIFICTDLQITDAWTRIGQTRSEIDFSNNKINRVISEFWFLRKD